MVKTNKFVKLLGEISLEIYDELGAIDFSEKEFQIALGYEFTAKDIAYIREPHIELYYKEIPVALGAPDFYLNEENPPVIIEMKLLNDIKNEHREQLKRYLVSIKRNPKSVYKKVTHGILLNFLKNDPTTYQETEGKGTKEYFKVQIERFTLDEEENLVLSDKLDLGEFLV